MKLKLLLKSYINKLFSDVHSAIIQMLVYSIPGGVVLSYILSETLQIYTKKLLLLPTPIWVSIILFLSILAYIYLKTKKLRPRQNSINYKIKYYEASNYKWKTKIYQDNSFEIEVPLICLKHNLILKQSLFSFRCPEENCLSIIYTPLLFIPYQEAKSYIDREIRIKKSF